MTKIAILIKRNFKEILRDPLSIVFCFVFPAIMLIIMPLIFNGTEYIPNNFLIENYVIGICVFGYCFVALFVALKISCDKSGEFINRIKIAPIKGWWYHLSFVIALIPVTFAQTVIFMAISLIFGLDFSAKIFLAVLYLFPSMLFYISIGVLIGTLCKREEHAGPICSIIITAGSMLGGIFMPTENMGAFTVIINYLPFVHTVKIASGVFQNNLLCFYPHILWVLAWTACVWIAIVFISKRKNKNI